MGSCLTVPLENGLQQRPVGRVLLVDARVKEQEENAFVSSVDQLAGKFEVLSRGGFHKPRRELTPINLEGRGRRIALNECRRVVIASGLQTVPWGEEICRNVRIVDNEADVCLCAEAAGGPVRT